MKGENQQNIKQNKLPLVLSMILIAGLVASYFIFNDVRDFFQEAYQVLTSEDEDRIAQWVSQFGWWGPAVIVLAMILQMFMLVVPSPLLMVISVVAYGPVLGTVINLTAIVAASSIGYALGVIIGIALVGKLISEENDEKIRFYIDRYGFWAVAITRLTPFLSNDAISSVAGILKMGYLKFIGATLLGIIPLAILIAYLGETNERLEAGLIIVSVLGILALIWYVVADRRRK